MAVKIKEEGGGMLNPAMQSRGSGGRTVEWSSVPIS